MTPAELQAWARAKAADLGYYPETSAVAAALVSAYQAGHAAGDAYARAAGPVRDPMRSLAGVYCEAGNNCGRLGCPECQQ